MENSEGDWKCSTGSTSYKVFISSLWPGNLMKPWRWSHHNYQNKQRRPQLELKFSLLSPWKKKQRLRKWLHPQSVRKVPRRSPDPPWPGLGPNCPRNPSELSVPWWRVQSAQNLVPSYGRCLLCLLEMWRWRWTPWWTEWLSWQRFIFSSTWFKGQTSQDQCWDHQDQETSEDRCPTQKPSRDFDLQWWWWLLTHWDPNRAHSVFRGLPRYYLTGGSSSITTAARSIALAGIWKTKLWN